MVVMVVVVMMVVVMIVVMVMLMMVIMVMVMLVMIVIQMHGKSLLKNFSFIILTAADIVKPKICEQNSVFIVRISSPSRACNTGRNRV